jgi:hypothetical protein
MAVAIKIFTVFILFKGFKGLIFTDFCFLADCLLLLFECFIIFVELNLSFDFFGKYGALLLKLVKLIVVL